MSHDFSPIARSSVSSEVHDRLVAAILSGSFSPGSPLPSERSLATQFEVNRHAVREAIKRLQESGLVEVSQGGNTRVLDWRRTAGLALLPLLMTDTTGAPRADVARSVLEMRACVGPDAARLAAEHAHPAAAHALEAAAARLAGADEEERLEVSWHFWELVISASGNIAYQLAYNSLRTAANSVGPALWMVLADELADSTAYRVLARAVAEGDGDLAAGSARALLTRGLDAFERLLPPAERHTTHQEESDLS